jgi:hypothetical protein
MAHQGPCSQWGCIEFGAGCQQIGASTVHLLVGQGPAGAAERRGRCDGRQKRTIDHESRKH